MQFYCEMRRFSMIGRSIPLSGGALPAWPLTVSNLVLLYIPLVKELIYWLWSTWAIGGSGYQILVDPLVLSGWGFFQVTQVQIARVVCQVPRVMCTTGCLLAKFLTFVMRGDVILVGYVMAIVVVADFETLWGKEVLPNLRFYEMPYIFRTVACFLPGDDSSHVWQDPILVSQGAFILRAMFTGEVPIEC